MRLLIEKEADKITQIIQWLTEKTKPCIRCGYCCRTATCHIGLSHGAQPTNCMFFTGKRPGEYSCLLAEKEVYPDIRMHLGIGSGCCSSLNADRRIAIENIEKLEVK